VQLSFNFEKLICCAWAAVTTTEVSELGDLIGMPKYGKAVVSAVCDTLS
jgi:hypothetical protein